MKALGRLLTAMVTPFDDKGAVNYERAKKLASGSRRTSFPRVCVTRLRLSSTLISSLPT